MLPDGASGLAARVMSFVPWRQLVIIGNYLLITDNIGMLMNKAYRVAILAAGMMLSTGAQALPQALPAEFAAAVSLQQQGKTEQAIAAYRAIIGKYPRVPEAYNNLAAIYVKQKKLQQARKLLEQGLRAHKGYAALYDNLVAINVAMARDAYSKALQLELPSASLDIAEMQPEAAVPAAQPQAAGSTDTATETALAEENVIADIAISAAETRNNHVAEAEETLLAWAAAWSAQAVDVYLSFYHPRYQPANGMSLQRWQKQRRYRLKKPKWIKVTLSDFDMRKLAANKVEVNFVQRYQSNTFSDKSNKQMVLLKTEDGWRIVSEISL